jgi:predicted TIM-barrel fold metal-dependent hydrolase
MPYVQNRLVHDAGSHIIEVPTALDQYIKPRFKKVIDELLLFAPLSAGSRERLLETNSSNSAEQLREAEQITLRKNWDALGGFRGTDRGRALDYLGFSSQLVFTTSLLERSLNIDAQLDTDCAYAIATAHNRYVVEFCSHDRRLLPVGYVPLRDFKCASDTARDAIMLGCKALLVPAACPSNHSPSHVDLDPVWAQAQEAGLPVVFHIGGGGKLLSPAYFSNGMSEVPGFLSEVGSITSVKYMAIPYPPMQTPGTMIIDGVFERFPWLRIGVMEQGASWLPGWMRMLDSAFTSFAQTEERLRKMSLKPSEYVQRQVRVAPYFGEDTAWIIGNSGEEICMCSSDYPHFEGGRDPVGCFDRSLAGMAETLKRRFYSENFIDLMGDGMPEELRYRAPDAVSTSLRDVESHDESISSP